MADLIRRIKYLILIVAGVASLAAAAGPSIAAAQTNQTVSDDTCAEWLGWYKQDLMYANGAVTAGKPAQVTSYYQQAAYDLQLATDAGCAWAQVAVLPKNPVLGHPGLAAPIKAISASRK